MAQRTPAEIRDSMENNRTELAVSVERLRADIVQLTDWRGHLRRHQSEVVAAGAVVGLVVVTRMLRRRRRRRRG